MHGTNAARLVRLAADINTLHARLEAGWRSPLEGARELGDKLHSLKDDVGHGNWLPWVEQHLEFSDRKARDYMAFATACRDPAYWRRVANLSFRDALKALPTRNAFRSVEHYTQADIIEAARRAFGGTIDLDVASSAEANTVVQATTFYTKQDNGLLLPWFGRVWMNHPYNGTDDWTEKLVREFDAGHLTAAIALVNSFTMTSGALLLMEKDFLICQPKNRLRFWGPGVVGRSQPCPSTLIYLGDDMLAFEREFQVFGRVLGPREAWQRGAA